MDIKKLDFILNDALNKALISKDRIKQPNSNNVSDFVSKYIAEKYQALQLQQTGVSGSFTSDVEKLTNDILKYFPKFFDDFTNFEYGTGVDAGKDFKKIFNKAKRLNKAVYKNYR